uniref:Uncharacterized protein n=1 Tax=Opuntia streptacantha TaxID=393608 RepID=A0A7C9A022_OPUST
MHGLHSLHSFPLAFHSGCLQLNPEKVNCLCVILWFLWDSNLGIRICTKFFGVYWYPVQKPATHNLVILECIMIYTWGSRRSQIGFISKREKSHGGLTSGMVILFVGFLLVCR